MFDDGDGSDEAGAGALPGAPAGTGFTDSSWGALEVTAVAGIAHLEGCAELASWLASVDPARLGEYDLVEVVAGFERVASWAKARSAAAAAELARRPLMNPEWPPQAGDVKESCVAAPELSLRLGVTQHAARRLVGVGGALDGVLQETGAALDRGDIDWGKAHTVVEALADMPWQVALEVEAVVLPKAPRRTQSQLRRDLARALAEVDPHDAQQRHQRAVGRRRVDRPRLLPDGMASVRAVLPAEAAVRLDATLQGAAVGARASGDSRTVDQLRADALDAMAGVAWDTGWIGVANHGVSVDPEGHDDGSERRHDDTERRHDGSELIRARSGPQSTSDVAGDRPRPMRVGRPSGRRAQVLVTVGIGTLLGLDERPAELEGYGPIGADVARRIASEGSTWRRLLVDAPSGAVVDVGKERYRPPPDMAELVRARNPHCVIPTCSVPASACDLDHTIPFAAEGGSTSVGGLGPLCRANHQHKTHGGFRLRQPEPGTFELRTPTGREYIELPVRPPGVPWESGGPPTGPGAVSDLGPPDDRGLSNDAGPPPF